jgi:hypothetical protein
MLDLQPFYFLKVGVRRLEFPIRCNPFKTQFLRRLLLHHRRHLQQGWQVFQGIDRRLIDLDW